MARLLVTVDIMSFANSIDVLHPHFFEWLKRNDHCCLFKLFQTHKITTFFLFDFIFLMQLLTENILIRVEWRFTICVVFWLVEYVDITKNLTIS